MAKDPLGVARKEVSAARRTLKGAQGPLVAMTDGSSETKEARAILDRQREAVAQAGFCIAAALKQLDDTRFANGYAYERLRRWMEKPSRHRLDHTATLAWANFLLSLHYFDPSVLFGRSGRQHHAKQ